MFEKTISSSILSWKCKFLLISFSFKSYQSFICSIPSSKSKEGEELVGVPNHPNWITFSRNSSNVVDSPGVITYINVRLSSFCFLL